MMKKQTKRRIYYISVIVSLVTILVCAVIINRTLVNTPKFEYDDSTVLAEEPVCAYMAYIDEEGNATVGIADEKNGDADAAIGFVKGISYTEEISEINISKNKIPDAWVVLYDGENRMSDRINFYDSGTVALLNGKCYKANPDDMQRLIELCNTSVMKNSTDENGAEEIVLEQEMIGND